MRKGFLFQALLLLFVIAFCSYVQPKHYFSKTTSDVLINYSIPIGRIADSLKIKKSKVNILIVKHEYRLYFVADTLKLKSYPVVFGFNPVDDKQKEGDGCTPEGTFKIKAKYPHKDWSKFIWIDYPNKDSWKKFQKAKDSGKIPKNASIGGDVGIHGVHNGADYAIDKKQNWTLGCISLKNHDIDEIYDFVANDTMIEIVK